MKLINYTCLRYALCTAKQQQNTLFINGRQFKIILYQFKLAQLTSFEGKNSFELSTQKTRLVGLILILTKHFELAASYE